VLVFGRFTRKPPERSADPSDEASASKHPAPLDPLPSGQKDSLEEYLGEAWPILKAMCRTGIRPSFNCSLVKANWKLLYEITLEEYHAFAVHPTSFGKEGYLNPDEAYHARFDPHSGFFYNGRSGDLSAMASGCQAGTYQPDAYRVLQIFPNFLINHY